MFEKISNQKQRDELVCKAKNRIVYQIKNEKAKYNNFLKSLLLEEDIDDCKQQEIMSLLLTLSIAQEYIESPYSFNEVVQKNLEQNVISYQVDSEHLNIFLLDDFNFAQNIIKYYNIFTIQNLSDKDIAYSDFISAIELCLLRNQLEKEN